MDFTVMPTALEGFKYLLIFIDTFYWVGMSLPLQNRKSRRSYKRTLKGNYPQVWVTLVCPK
jgi:hypothetical protein